MLLKDAWYKMSNYSGGDVNHFINNEIELLPFRYSQGKWQSYNSDDRNLIVVAEFLRIQKPICVLECGTFEARSTEYFTRVMRTSNPNPNKILVTIDVEGCILHMGEEYVTFYDDEGYNESMKIRKARLELLQCDPFVKVIYREGLTQLLLPNLLQEFNFDFIYEDASHLTHILKKDWEHINKFTKENCVVCFDDMAGNEFKDWLYENAKNWELYYTDLERGQIWAQKIKGEQNDF